MLNTNDLGSLYQVISDENKTFEHIINNFQKSFPKSDQFKVGICLWFMIKDNLLNIAQRLASFYILYEMYKSDSITPFYPIVLETLQNNQNQLPAEKKLLSELYLNTMNRDTLKMTVKNFIEQNKNIDKVQISNELNQYWQLHEKERVKLSTMLDDWVRPVLCDWEENQKKMLNETNPPFNINNLDPVEVSMNRFESNYMTLNPNNSYPIHEDEALWIIPTLKYDFMWDYNMSPEEDSVLTILFKPLNNKMLTEEQMKFVLDIFTENPNFIAEIQFSPENLMKLVEKSPNFATEIFLKISNSEYFQDYLSPFLNHPFSVNSMEVLNRVIQNVELPVEFLHRYIRHCLDGARSEKNLRNKAVRIVAFFLYNLLDHGHLAIDGISNELMKFCEDFLKDIKEIKNLHTKLTSMMEKK